MKGKLRLRKGTSPRPHSRFVERRGPRLPSACPPSLPAPLLLHPSSPTTTLSAQNAGFCCSWSCSSHRSRPLVCGLPSGVFGSHCQPGLAHDTLPAPVQQLGAPMQSIRGEPLGITFAPTQTHEREWFVWMEGGESHAGRASLVLNELDYRSFLLGEGVKAGVLVRIERGNPLSVLQHPPC